MQQAGKKPIIVHGGGPAINMFLEKLAITSEFIDGLRKTTSEVLEAAEMVLCGKVNTNLVKMIQKLGGQSIGLTGCDNELLQVKAIDEERLGYVGEPTSVNSELLQSILKEGLIPVIAPIGMNEEGTHYNVNADSAAGAIAKAMEAEQLIFVTDVDGILKDGKCLKEVTEKEINEYIADGTIYGGMIPKVKAALSSFTHSLQSVRIINGKETVINEDGTIKGTTIIKSQMKM